MPAEPAIFIIDDDPSVSGALRRLMKSAGFSRIEAFDSAEDFLKRADIENGSILILDIMLPGISGIDLGQFIRSTGLNASAVFISAHEKELDKARTTCPEALGFLLKPFGGDELLRIVRRFLAQQAGAGEHVQSAGPVSDAQMNERATNGKGSKDV
jgi:FixJ family two-component response regulator